MIRIQILNIWTKRSGARNKFEDEPQRFEKLYCVWSKFGLLNSVIEKDYLWNIFFPTIEDECVLVHDSWNGYAQSVSDEIISAKFSSFLKLPPKTTSILQPLNLFFNYFFKQALMHIHNKIQIDHRILYFLSVLTLS